jgi:hypothetical protein
MAVSSGTASFSDYFNTNVALLARNYKVTVLLSPDVAQLNVLCIALIKSLKLGSFQNFLPSSSS